MCAGRVRFQCEATPRLSKSPVELTMKQESNRKYPVSLRLFFVQLNRALRDFQTGLQRPLGDFGPPIDVVVQMGEADRRKRRCEIRINRNGTFEHVACFDIAAPGGMPH